MAHIMLPEPAPRTPLRSPGKFAVTAAAILVDSIERAGGRRGWMTAKVCGGAHLFNSVVPPRATLGDRNVQATLKALEIESVPVVGTDVGGNAGRTIQADLATGVVLVKSLRGQLKRL